MLLCAKSSEPNRSSVAATSRSTISPCVASQCIASASPPASWISDAVSSASASDRSAIITRAPRWAKAMAEARPIPAPAPVTSAVLPAKSENFIASSPPGGDPTPCGRHGLCALGQHVDRCRVEGGQRIAVARFVYPMRVLQDGATHRGDVEFPGFEPAQHQAEVVRRLGYSVVGIVLAFQQADAANDPRQLAGQLLGPARQR